jgi:hypothetical protein
LIKLAKIKTGVIIESLFLFLVFAIMLNVGCGVLFDHKIVHDYPFGLLASDAFQHQTRAESIKEIGNYKYEAPYIAHGYTDVIGNYMPVFYHLGVLLSYSTGIESWDAIYFMLFFSSCLSALVIYIIIRNFNKHIAILSLPLSILIFSKVPYIGYTWGQWPNIFALFFLTAFFWSLQKIDLKCSPILIGLLLAAVEMTHTTMFIFAILFAGFYFGILLLLKRFKIEYIKKLLATGAIFILFGGYPFMIFLQTWSKLVPFVFESLTKWPGGSGSFNLPDFRIMLIPMAIGIIASLLMLKKNAKSLLPLSIGFFALLFGYSNYVGFRHRAFTLRIFWPIFLSIFLGIGLYYTLKIFIKNWKLIYSLTLSTIILLLLNSTFSPVLLPHAAKFTSTGLMDSYHWDTLMWLKENTPLDTKIYFFYGDTYHQDALLRNVKREHYLVELRSKGEDIGFIDAVKSKTIKRNYRTRKPGDSGAGLPYKESFLKYNFYTEKDNYTSWYRISRDSCNFDYYVFDKLSREPILAQYNLLIMQEMMKSGFMEIVYENEISYIVRNKQPGADCIATED